MKLKTLIYCCIFVIFAASCSESVLEADAVKSTTPELKAATISSNYYVSKTGSDSNTGTSSAPFLTIQKAANVVNPGDTVIVRDGIYTTSATQVLGISRGGTSASRVVFKSEHKWGAIMDGQNGATMYPIQFNSSASYVDILDFEMRNFHRGIWANDATNPSNFITLKGNKIHDFGRNQVDGGGGLYVGRYHHDWVITKNMFYNIGNTSTTAVLNLDHAIYVIITAPSEAETPYNFEVSCNIFWGCSGDAMQVGFHHSKIVNNVFAWSNENSSGGRGFIVTDSPTTFGGRYITIANNIFYQALTSGSYSIRSYSGVVGWSVENNMTYGGRMWYADTPSADITAASGGNNYGQVDCEHAEINPLFTYAVKADAINANFQLQSGSHAINAGVDVGLTTDYLGNPIVGLPDIGAFKYQSSNSITTTTYYNVQVSATATKNSCGTGYTGSTVTYTVAASKYSSTVSQVDADNKALADLNNNKQAYANANGTCTAIPATVYYNTQVSATATKNSCGTGYTGSTVTYTVSSNKYSSTVSQSDADSKALADLTSNKQAYANTNGTCTAIPVTVYSNTQVSATATKNSCGTGYVGSRVIYTVSAGKYTSTVSQADADAKAASDLSTNTQSYANLNGTCTKIRRWR